MPDATTLRLDTADAAVAVGWQVETPMRRIDEYSKDGVTIEVQYELDDEISSLTRSRPGRADEVFDPDSPGKAERLGIWLGVRMGGAPESSSASAPRTHWKGGDKPSWAVSLAMGRGKAHTFRLDAAYQAELAGWVVQATYDTTTFIKGQHKLVAEYDANDFVRNVQGTCPGGTVNIVQKDKDKYINLVKALKSGVT